MKPVRSVLAALALTATLPAAATVTTTYNFGSAAMTATNPTVVASDKTTSATGVTTWRNSSAAQYGDGGSNYGNTIMWAGSTAGSSVTVSAWSTTAVGNKFESAYIGNYGGDLGVTGQPRAGLLNAELNASNAPNTANSEHAIDNVGAYDALVFSFSSAVTLADVSIGFPSATSGLDSDSTILYYKGTGTPSTTLSARTVADLVSSGQWGIATNLGNMAVGNNATGLSTSISSQYWMVGAYMSIGGNAPAGGVDTKADYFKVNGLTAVRAVPEPSSLALLGLAGLMLALRLRGRASRA